MSKLLYTHEAKTDLAKIKEYINTQLENPTAAKNTVTKITKRIRKLEAFLAVRLFINSKEKHSF